MPQIMLKGLSENQVSTLAKNTSENLSKIVGCPADWFIFDSISSTIFSHTGEKSEQAIIAVHWFKREQEIQDKVALCLDKELEKLGFQDRQISFSVFLKECYYENGTHY